MISHREKRIIFEAKTVWPLRVGGAPKVGQASVVQQNLDRKWANHRKCPPRHKIQMKYARQRGKWCKRSRSRWSAGLDNDGEFRGNRWLVKERWDDQRIGEAFCDTIVSYNFLTQLSGRSFWRHRKTVCAVMDSVDSGSSSTQWDDCTGFWHRPPFFHRPVTYPTCKRLLRFSF